MLLRISLLEHAVRSELLGPGSRPLQTFIQSTVLERLMPSTTQHLPGWHVSTSRFIQQPSQTRWRQDYQSFSHYQPC